MRPQLFSCRFLVAYYSRSPSHHRDVTIVNMQSLPMQDEPKGFDEAGEGTRSEGEKRQQVYGWIKGGIAVQLHCCGCFVFA